MNFRNDLLQAVKNETGETYEEIAARCGVASTTLCDVFKGVVDPRASTLKTIFEGMKLDPKNAMNFNLSKTEFRRAVANAAR